MDEAVYTGVDRSTWIRTAESLLRGFLQKAQFQGGECHVPEAASEAAHYESLMEGYGGNEAAERIMVLMASYVAGTGRRQLPGREGDLSEPFLRWVLEGTDPRSPSYWGPHKRYSAFGSCVALAFLLAKAELWDVLSLSARQQIGRFLAQLTAEEAYDNNHWYFHMMPAPLLDEVGIAYDRSFLDSRWERLLSWHLGQGWFLDGNNQSVDYYNAWGFHLYNRILCHYDPEWGRRYEGQTREMLAAFLEGYIHFFDTEGRMIPYGRSLSYRFAAAAPWVWAQVGNLESVPAGLCRRIASGLLKSFFLPDRNETSEWLEPGFYKPNCAVAETYIAVGSSYFSSVGFTALLMPPEHPFWTAPEAALPQDSTTQTHMIESAGLVVRSSPRSSRLYPVEQAKCGDYWQIGEKYFHHAYDSRLGFALTGHQGKELGANRTGVSRDGLEWFYRKRPAQLLMRPDVFGSRYAFALGKGREGQLISYTVPLETGELHLFYHTAKEPLFVHLGGYGLHLPVDSELTLDLSASGFLVRTRQAYSVIQPVQAPDGMCRHRLLSPEPGWEYSHLFGGRGVFPQWQSTQTVAANTLVAIYVGAGEGERPSLPNLRVEAHRRHLTVSCGEITVEWDLVNKL